MEGETVFPSPVRVAFQLGLHRDITAAPGQGRAALWEADIYRGPGEAPVSGAYTH